MDNLFFMTGGIMRRLYARLAYELIQEEIFERLDEEGRVTYNEIVQIAMIAFYKVALLFCQDMEAIMECCTMEIGYTLEEFIGLVRISILDEDQELINRIETRL